jgi:hypothetical protein
MKNVRKFCAALVLTLSFALPALAGDMPAPGMTAAQPKQEYSVTSTVSETSESAWGGVSAPELDPLTALTLSLLESILSIF